MLKNPAFVQALKYGHMQAMRVISSQTPVGTDRMLRDIYDGDLMQQICHEYPAFASGPLNLMLGLACDAFVAFRHKGGALSNKSKAKQYSVLPLTVVAFNLPPHIRTRIGAMHVAGIIPGPSCKVIQPFLEPLRDELLYTWVAPLSVTIAQPPKPPSAAGGDHTSNVSMANGFARSMLIHIMADYRGEACACACPMQDCASMPNTCLLDFTMQVSQG